MANDSIRVPVYTLVSFMIDACVAMGVPPNDAAIIADVLITSDLWGVRSHGIAHLKMYHERIQQGLQLPVTRLTLSNDTPTTAVIDGGNGMGMVVSYRAMKLAMQKARQYGLGAVAVRNSSHFGVAGYYPLMAVQEGMVGVSCTNAHPSIAPTFGVRPMLGTNPIAIAAPTDEPFPYMFDAATAIVPRGKIEIAARANAPIPEGWVIGEDGNSVTESVGLIKRMSEGKAALFPLGGMGEATGGHKGYGLATMVEIFSAAFQDGTYLWGLTDTDADGKPQFLRIGHFFLAIDVEHFVPLATFKRITGSIMRDLRGSPRSPRSPGGGTSPLAARIYTAGEKEYYNSQRVRAEGVEILPGVQKALHALREELGLHGHNLGF